MSRRLSEVTGDDVMVVLADIVDLLASVSESGDLSGVDLGAADGDQGAAQDEGKYVRVAATMLRKHPSEVMRLLADVQGVAVEEYSTRPIGEVMGDVMAVLTDDSLSDFFQQDPTPSQSA